MSDALQRLVRVKLKKSFDSMLPKTKYMLNISETVSFSFFSLVLSNK
jgi:hypothetical protein